MGSHSGEINISHYFSYEDNSVGYPTQVRYFWDYCASVNIIFKKARAKGCLKFMNFPQEHQPAKLQRKIHGNTLPCTQIANNNAFYGPMLRKYRYLLQELMR